MMPDNLIPSPGRCDYLISNGPRALVSEQSQEGWPFELALYTGRKPLGLKLRAAKKGPSSFEIASVGDETAAKPGDLSLFVRACIRRSENDRCTLSWPASLRLDANDPLAAHTRFDGARIMLDAFYADLRPGTRSPLTDVYRYPLDIPWLYDPLDYEVMIPILNAQGVRRILDLGCGSGRNAVPLENAGYEVHGIDLAPASIEICRRFVQAPGRFHVASAASVPFPEAHFDAVLDVGCLHMLPDHVSRATVLAEVARSLKPGGFLCGRALTPRGPNWLAAQPFRSEATGFHPHQIIAEAAPNFEARILGQTQHLTYYKLLKIVY